MNLSNSVGSEWSSVATICQLGFVFHAISLNTYVNPDAATGTCDAAIKSASLFDRSAQKPEWYFARSYHANPSLGARIPFNGSAGYVLSIFNNDSPLSGAKAAT